jgi:hypothetical protein
MTHTDDADSMDTWLSALRSDYQPAPSAARERIASRLVEAGLAAVALGGAVAVTKLAPRSFLYSQAFAAIVTLPVGLLLGAAGHAWLVRPTTVASAPPALTATATATATLPLPPTPFVADPLPPLEQLNPQPVTPKTRSTSSAVETLGLEHELRLLEQARTKLSEGQPAGTLELLRRHRAQYPQSALEQEREALSVRALMAAGRRAEAQKQAAAFVQRYPGSVLRGSVERAVGKIP